MQREDMGVSMAARLATSTALEAAGIGVQDLDFLDLYSCFPIAVFNICDGLNISTQDPRGLTVTGGLPYFGGPGNSYSMHGIASMVEKLRAKPGSYGLVGANGGQMSKYAAGVYSTRPREFRAIDSAPDPGPRRCATRANPELRAAGTCNNRDLHHCLRQGRPVIRDSGRPPPGR